MKKILWLDVDGVLLDYTRAFIKFADIQVDYHEMQEYDLVRYFDSKQACENVMNEFLLSDQFSYLRPLAETPLLFALKNVGYEIRAITRIPALSTARYKRVVNLSTYFGSMFDEIVFTNAGQCKYEYLLDRLHEEKKLCHYIVIEDDPVFLKTANDRNHIGITAYGVLHPYNTSACLPLLHVAGYSSFNDIARMLIEKEVSVG